MWCEGGKSGATQTLKKVTVSVYGQCEVTLKNQMLDAFFLDELFLLENP